MAQIIIRTNADGSKAYGAQVSVKGFDRTYRSFQTKAECVAWQKELTEELRRQRQRGNARPDLPSATVGALNAAYLADPVVFSERAPRYVEGLRRSLAWWTLHYGAVRVMQFGALQQREARDALLAGTVRGGAQRAAGTVVRRLAAQRSAWRWGQTVGIVAADHAWAPKLMPREPKGRVRFLSDAELSALLTAARAASGVLYAAVLLAIATGLRKGELLALQWKDIDWSRERIQVLLTKNGEARAVHMPPTVTQALRELKGAPVVSATHVFVAEGTGRPLTPTMLQALWHPARDQIGLRDFRWHDLRHTCASYLAQNGATALEIADVLGHKTLAMVKRYSHLTAGKAVTGHDKLDSKLRGS